MTLVPSSLESSWAVTVNVCPTCTESGHLIILILLGSPGSETILSAILQLYIYTLE